MKTILGKITILTLLIAGIAGCTEVTQDKYGRIIKINKFTGEGVIIDGDKVIKIKSEKDLQAEQDALNLLSKPHFLPTLTISTANHPSIKMSTMWTDGVMHYKIIVNKNLSDQGEYVGNGYYGYRKNPEVTIEFNDTSDFLLASATIMASQMTGTLSDDGKTVAGMEYKGSIRMGSNTYKKISNWNVAWSGFRPDNN